METLRRRAYSLKRHTQFSNLNMLLNHLASNINCFLRKATVFLHSLERGCLAQSWCASPLKMLTVSKRSFQMLTRFPMQNKVKGPLACNANASLAELQCFSHLLEWDDSVERWCYSSRETLRVTQYSFKEQTECTILTKFLDALVSNIKDSLTKAAVFLPFNSRQWFYTEFLFSTMKTVKVRLRSSLK
jgi:hypothetical protein